MLLQTQFPFLFSYATPSFIQRVEPLLEKKAIPVQNLVINRRSIILVTLAKGKGSFFWYGCDVCSKKFLDKKSGDEVNCTGKKCGGVKRMISTWYSMGFLTSKDDINTEELWVTIFSKEPLQYYDFIRNRFVLKGILSPKVRNSGSIEYKQFTVKSYERYSQEPLKPIDSKSVSLDDEIKNLFLANRGNPIEKSRFDQWLLGKHLNPEIVYISPLIKVENDYVSLGSQNS